MSEILQWLLLLLLGGCAGWFWRDRTTHRPPGWLFELDEEELVRQGDLDQYHHRVVQLSHAQRELLTKRIDALDRRLAEFEGASPASTAVVSPPVLAGVVSETPHPAISENPIPPEARDPIPHLPETPTEALIAEPQPTLTQIEASEESPVGIDAFDPTTRVLDLWREGRPVEEIARELRMGRQEVQLLIEMSRHLAVPSRR